MTNESSPMMMAVYDRLQEKEVAYGRQDVGRRKGAEELVVTWT
jgi:hypothetical protein